MVTTSKLLKKIQDLFFSQKKASIHPMWAYEVEMTRYNAAVFGITKKNMAAVKALDRFYTITTALVYALILLLPSFTQHIHVLSFISLAVLGAVAGGKVIFKASIIAPFFYSIFSAGIALDQPVALHCMLIWLSMYILYHGLSEAYNLFIYMLVTWFNYDYDDFRQGTGMYAHFPRVFTILQGVSLFAMFIVSWNTFISLGVVYPFALIGREALNVLCYSLPQALCVAWVKHEYDIALMLYHRLWDNYRADIADGHATFKALVLGSVIAIAVPCACEWFRNGGVEIMEVLKEALICTGIVWASLCLFPLWRLLLSTPSGGGVLVTTPAIDRRMISYDLAQVLDSARDSKYGEY